jgi:hypothetical protein
LSHHTELVLSLLEKWGHVPPGGIRPEHHMVHDLKVDGDDYGMSLVPEIKKRLGISPKRQEWEVATVGELLALVEQHMARKGSEGGQASA